MMRPPGRCRFAVAVTALRGRLEPCEQRRRETAACATVFCFMLCAACGVPRYMDTCRAVSRMDTCHTGECGARSDLECDKMTRSIQHNAPRAT